ncbi:MAG: enoyl-CoA hydratase-related protein [Christensenella sp.]|nr:enoyl-CoA hydratase-related protein [Christensenella sp.]
MQFAKLERVGSVAILTIHRPQALNALNAEVLSDIASALDLLTRSDRCIVITGAGEKAFVAGADIALMRNQNKTEAMAFARIGSDLFRRIEQLQVPVIAAVNGYALGGGFELALACDIRLASENAVFALPEVTLGIIPGFGGTQRIMRALGVGMAKELLFTGRKMKAQEALNCGLVNRVFAPEALMSGAIDLATDIAANAPIAIRTAKAAANLCAETSLETGLEAALHLYVGCYETQDQQNAMSAFVEKRRPDAFEDR